MERVDERPEEVAEWLENLGGRHGERARFARLPIDRGDRVVVVDVVVDVLFVELLVIRWRSHSVKSFLAPVAMGNSNRRFCM